MSDLEDIRRQAADEMGELETAAASLAKIGFCRSACFAPDEF
ncbi:MAG TPA: hypothetical protein VM934_07435 [Pyrinomonadaceae bacterium]|jgi:hypothetical protein|nr:hypothetical protein [Pyrinomonadaceae bacterium]